MIWIWKWSFVLVLTDSFRVLQNFLVFAARYANIAKQFLYSLRGCLSVRRDGTLNGISPCMYISLLCFYLLFGDEYWQFCQLNKSLHDRTITMSLCNEYFLRNCLLYGRRDGMFAVPFCRDVFHLVGPAKRDNFYHRNTPSGFAVTLLCWVWKLSRVKSSWQTSRPGKHPVPPTIQIVFKLELKNAPSRQTSRPAYHINSF